jgi:hypothetical protein
MDDGEKRGNRKRHEAKERTERGDEKSKLKKEKFNVHCTVSYMNILVPEG